MSILLMLLLNPFYRETSLFAIVEIATKAPYSESMAKKTVVQYFSDLSGKPVDEGSTVSFGLSGTNYEIDLTPKERGELERLLAPYVDAGRPAAARRGSATGNGHDPRAVRAWAVEQGLNVPQRGRIPAALIGQYEAAH